MARQVLVFLVCVWSQLLVAQSTNQWINFDQTYFRIPVAKKGIYRVSYEQLVESGFPVGSVDPTRIQLLHRGSEVAIKIEGSEDGSFDPGDYILFYGRSNDGESDTPLYRNPEYQPHRYYNLFSDTTSFFLTEGTAPGKRMITHPNGGAADDVPFHFAEKLIVFSESYGKGPGVNDEIYSSAFDAGEGWTSQPIRQGQFRDIQVDGITKRVESGPKPRLEIVLTGRNAIAHTVEVRVGAGLRLLTTLNTDAFQPFLYETELDWADITAGGALTVRLAVPNRGYNDQVSVSYIRITFPQESDAFNATQANFVVPAAPSARNLVIHNAPSGYELYDVTDPYNVFAYQAGGSPGLFVTVPASAAERQLIGSSELITPDRVVPTSFQSFEGRQPDYVIITHPLLRRPAKGVADPVGAYANYRASAEGGGFDPLVVNIGELYNQFNYGEQSPLAIFRFLEFLSSEVKPAYLLLIGKGLEYDHRYYRTPNSGTWQYQDLVPTGGMPGSDAAFSMRRDVTSEEAIATGRIPAMSSEEVVNYLDKVIELESQPITDLQRKRILHLSGGIEDWEPEAFKGYLAEFQSVAEGPYFGGVVSAIAKQSRDVQTINIAKQINEGLQLVTFFGHSSTSTLDFDIGYVSDKKMGYNNRGKYPMMLMNGCEVGAFFLQAKLFGEDWILAEKLGASNFLGHNAIAGTNTLYRYAQTFYNVAFADLDLIGRGIGDVKIETAKRFLASQSAGTINRSQVEQMILLGDPAIKLTPALKPDLEVKASHVSFVPFNDESVTALADSFAIKFVVTNYGLATDEPFRVEVVRTMEDNSIVVYDSIYTVPRNTDTLTLVIRRGVEDPAGNNTFHILIDADDFIEELNESNNQAEAVLIIPGNGTKHLYPAPYAIVNSSEVKLSLQATNVFSDKRRFTIQLDTVASFDSEWSQEVTVEGTVLASHTLTVLDSDSVTYYWRSKLESPLEGESGEWTTTSFTVIHGSPEGWAQLDFPQYIGNVAAGLAVDAGSRRINFLESALPVDIVTFGESAGKPADSVSVRLAGQEYNLFGQGFGCRLNTINLIAFDRKSTTPYVGVYLKWYEILFQFGGRRLLCGREPFVINSFTHNETYTGSGNDLIEYIDTVAEGDSVVMFNIGNADIGLWPEAARAKVAELGISSEQLSQIASGEPVVIFARKGANPGSARIYRHEGANPQSEKLVVNGTITGGYSSGALKSVLIGPAQEWNSVHYRLSEVELQDNVRIEVRGVTLDRQEVELVSSATSQQDLSFIDAQQYPILRLVFHTEDDVLLTSAQLEKWLVLYTPVPEGVLLPETGSDVQTQLQEGENFARAFRFVNVSSRDFPDSLSVNMSMYNHQRAETIQSSFRIGGPLSGDTTFFNIARETVGGAGLNDLGVYVNPRVLAEQYYDNNNVLLRRTVDVVPDKSPPVTEVTFDGKLIENGDFVSPAPVIRVTVRDDNSFLPKLDTLGIEMYLVSPCDFKPCETLPIYFSRDDVQFTPASLDSPYVIQFTPVLTNGEYTFSVLASDSRGNRASNPYAVSFRVDQESNVTFALPSPNPFWFETEVEFTIRGHTPPDAVHIQIFDLAGRPVWQANSTSLSIGKNSLRWDGTDSSGGYLNSGMYLYTISLSLEGKTFRQAGKILLQR